MINVPGVGCIYSRSASPSERQHCMAEIANALTVDVEDYFQVSALAPQIRRVDWDRTPCRVEQNVDRILDLFLEARARATFFTLGWIAERYPQLVRRIVEAGPELRSETRRVGK